jgi:O-acetyl-ADP-ribose deacetylase (regulator of RNase III)
MINVTRGNIIEADAEALVNTVNCEGVMGKGIALQFKKAFPENFKAYARACRAGEVRPGRMFVFATHAITNPKYIINFPTKRRWREKSRMEDIEAGLVALVDELRRLNVSSVAIPPLGCGLGGLDWREVRPRIERALAALPGMRVILFEPAGTPDARHMPIRTKRPKLTLARALLLRLMQQYSEMAYRLTLLEIQKLAYFLQEAGQPLRLKYVAHLYGPYAHNLNKVLETLDGHFIRGYGDSHKPDADIELVPGAVEEAERLLMNDAVARLRLQRVANLIEGFETPYGMELLSSVHWAARYGEPPARNEEDAIAALARWSARKQAMFKPAHIRVAWHRLDEQGWLTPSASAG